MNRQTLLKYALVFGIVIVGVFLDQWTKQIAEARLATQRPGYFSHNIVLVVPESFEGKTVREYVTHEFGDWNEEHEINDILRGVTNDGAVLLSPNHELKAGDVVEVRSREVVVVEDYFDFQYTRNKGAAFSFLANADASFRAPFFIGVSALAVLIILWILRGVTLSQQILLWGLSFVCSGAIGNLIDRVRLGYVIDFIVWKWTDAYRWPTFNIADSLICVGVALMLIEMIRDSRRQKQAAAAETNADADADAR